MSSAKTGAGCFVLIIISVLVSAFLCLHALRFFPTSLTGLDPHVTPVQPEPPPDPEKEEPLLLCIYSLFEWQFVRTSKSKVELLEVGRQHGFSGIFEFFKTRFLFFNP